MIKVVTKLEVFPVVFAGLFGGVFKQLAELDWVNWVLGVSSTAAGIIIGNYILVLLKKYYSKKKD